MSMYRVISCVVGRGCFLGPVCSFGKTLLAFALLYFILRGQTGLLFHVSSESYFCIPVSSDEKGLFCVCVFFFVCLFVFGDSYRMSLGLHRIIQIQLLWYWCLRHRLGLLWYWIVFLGNKQRSFCHFWDCNQVFHFRLFCWLWGLLHFF